MTNSSIKKVIQKLSKEEIKILISDYITFLTNEYTQMEDISIDKYIEQLTPKHCETCRHHFYNPFDQIYCRKLYKTEEVGCELKEWEQE